MYSVAVSIDNCDISKSPVSKLAEWIPTGGKGGERTGVIVFGVLTHSLWKLHSYTLVTRGLSLPCSIFLAHKLARWRGNAILPC